VTDPRARLAQRLRDLTEATYPLSYPQRRLWFLDQLTPGSPAYNVPLSYRITGPLDVPAFAAALREVVRRHEVLRTVVRVIDGEPRQVVRPVQEEPVEVALVDLSGADDPAAAADRLATESAREPFDLGEGPLLRAALLRLGPDDHRFVLTVHHLVCDAWSLDVIGREMSAGYAALRAGRAPELPDLPMQYGEYAAAELRRLRGPVLDDLTRYWRDALDGAGDAAGFPTDHARPPVVTYRGAAVDVAPPDGLSTAVADLARSTGYTPYTVLLAAFAALVARYTGDERVVLGTPVANREAPGTEPLVGCFTNVLVLALRPRPSMRFADLVREVGRIARAAQARAGLPFEKLVEELHPDRDLAHNPLFGVLFSYRTDDAPAWTLPGCAVTPVVGDTGTAKFDLTLSLVDGERLGGRLEYATDLFTADTARRLAAQYVTLLAAAVAEPERAVGDLPVLPDAERRRLLALGTAPAAGSGDACVHERIERRVRVRPDDVAVEYAGRTLTYGGLDAAADRLAGALRAAGAGPGTRVGVFLERSESTVVALLAVLKSGAAYVPLDPSYPAQRLRFVAADAELSAVVTAGPLSSRAAALAPVVLDVTATGPDAADPPARPVHPDDAAYVIYTSGSTGNPKGVVVTHRNVTAFFGGCDGVLGADPPGRWLAVTGIGFDIAVLELLWTLTRGHRVVLRPAEPAAGATATPTRPPARGPAFSLFYFGSDADRPGTDPYRLLRAGAQFADRNGFTAVWTPERHFHRFGGLFPNPALTAAALAMLTERVQIRAGSVVLPLHDPLEVAEQWAVVDNLSGGRVGVSFASGWQPTDFVLAPDNYADRKEIMRRAVSEVRALWRGGVVRRRGGVGAEVDVGIRPRPVQPELPVWLTSAKHPDTFRMAGQLGAGVLTHLLGHDIEQLGQKIALYRESWRTAGHAGEGHVAVMLHTFVGADRDAVRRAVADPLREYLRTSLDLVAGLSPALGADADLRALPAHELDELVDRAFDRFFATSGLLGTVADATDTARRLAAIGVNELACLIDFGVADDDVIAALPALASLREAVQSTVNSTVDSVADSAVDSAVDGSVDEPLAEQLLRHRTTHLQCTPSLARVLVEQPEARAALGRLDRMLVGGEALPGDLAARLAGAVGGEVRNMYGPTEATVWATSAPVRPGGGVRIGAPLAGVRAYVVDAALRLVPTGAPGELVLGGDYVARGYWRRPGLTAQRFVPDPFADRPGARLYRTGDLVRWRPDDGGLEFLGRLDDQVKIRGHRIEPGEIEAALVEHSAVGAAVAVARGEGTHRAVVAYLVAAGARPARPSDAELRGFLAASLPDAMIPARYVWLTALPLTPNGKIDRWALPDPTTPAPAAYVAPRTDLETLVADVWREVLRTDRMGVEDNFFDRGGNSLMVVQVRTRLRQRTGLDVSLVDLFRYPTVAALAAALDARSSAGPSATATEDGAAGETGARRRAALARAGQARRDRRSR
jgi:natural product biosynthesis luciferase-like monooxygenase protein